MTIFPEIEGSNLEGQKYCLPNDLEGELNLVIIPFQRYQQYLVNEWGNYLTELVKKYPNLEFYEIPTLARGYKLVRFMIDGGMRAGIPNKRTRERTITLYTNKGKFKEQLEIDSEDTIYLFLITKKGKILWREEGNITNEKTKDLESVLKNQKIS
ncbi:MAG: hypothetical protein GF308_11500 [Candidatus Heimdallarchaeota archaeon]|nr:hypothetical protein [Candidatus Heimdallarchaeota archaeon]